MQKQSTMVVLMALALVILQQCTADPVSTTLSATTTTPGSVAEDCAKSTSCGDCAGLNKNCYWCPYDDQKEDFQKTNTNKTECFHIEKGVNGLVECEHCASQDKCKTRVCFVSMKLLVIILPSVGGGIILIFGIWIWCCCRKRSKRKLKTFEMKQTKKDKLSAKRREDRSKVRKQERREKTSGLRAKYGLQSNDSDDEDLVGNEDTNDGW